MTIAAPGSAHDAMREPAAGVRRPPARLHEKQRRRRHPDARHGGKHQPEQQAEAAGIERLE